MTGYAAPIQRLIQELGRLPGIGEKTATRLAMFILRWSPEEAKRLAESIVDVKEKIRFCSVCFNLAEGELCAICSDPARDRERICVVEADTGPEVGASGRDAGRVFETASSQPQDLASLAGVCAGDITQGRSGDVRLRKQKRGSLWGRPAG